MMEGRTSFIVAHRLSTIKEADVILVISYFAKIRGYRGLAQQEQITAEG